MKHNKFTKCRPHRLYINNLPSKAYVSITQAGRLVVSSEEKWIEENLRAALLKKLGSANPPFDIDFLSDILNEIPQSEITSLNDSSLDNIVNFSAPKKKRNRYNKTSYDELLNTKTSQQLAAEAQALDISTITMRAKTANASVIIDHREPDELFNIMSRSKIDSVDVGHLPLGDILVTDGEKELIFERKTITDFNRSVTGDEGHAHDQVERYHEYQNKRALEGVHVRFVWIIEGEKNGDRTLYNSLRYIQNTDGFIGYLAGVSDQFVFGTYNLNHTAYLAVKISQCYLERKLINGVRINGVRIDRQHEHQKITIDDNGDRGVSKSTQGLAQLLCSFDGVRANVAKELANTGKSAREILQMSHEELMKIKGISDKSAKRIHDSFNLRQT